MGRRHLGGHDLVRRTDKQGEILIWCRKCSGTCETEIGIKIDELLQAGASGHKRARQNVKTNSGSRRWQGSCQEGKRLEDCRTIEKNHQEGISKTVKSV